MPQTFGYVQARQQAGGFTGALFARDAQLEQRLHDDVEGGDARDHSQKLANPADGGFTHFQDFARRGGDQIHPFIAVADIDVAAIGEIVGVQRTQQGRFSAAGVAVQHHAFADVYAQRGVGEYRQTHAVLLVQNKGFMDVFHANGVHF